MLTQPVSLTPTHKTSLSTLLAILSFCSDQDSIKLISSSKMIVNSLGPFCTKEIQRSLGYYRILAEKNTTYVDEAHLSYRSMRDYLILLYMIERQKTNKKITFDDQKNLVRSLTSTHLIMHPKEILEPEEGCDVWDEIVAATNAKSTQVSQTAVEKIKRRLQEEKIPEKWDTVAKLMNLTAHLTSVVVTFDTRNFDITTSRLRNYFQTKYRLEKKEIDPEYFVCRLTSEILNLRHCTLGLLMVFILTANAHPCYGTLQFVEKLEVLPGYGNAFAVFGPRIKSQAIASFGTGYSKFTDFYSILSPRMIAPLVANFSPEVLGLCVQYDTQARHLVMNERDNFIEVLFPSNLPLADPKQVDHLHFDEMEMLFSKYCTLMDTGITLSIFRNPFHDAEFCMSFKTNQVKQFLTAKIIDYINMALCHIGETTAENLTVVLDQKFLRLKMRITPNYYALHQAQAAAVLYVLGVHDFFKKVSAIDFDPGATTLEYNLILDGVARKEGKLTDQDGYDSSYPSLMKLLNQILKRIFSVLLVSRQNAEYLRKHNKPHPVTGAGATEEANQTRPLHLGDEHKPYDLEVYWFYDSVILHVLSQNKEDVDFVLNSLKTYGAKWVGGKIYFDHALQNILHLFRGNRSNYQASIIYDDEGDILLACRRKFACGLGYTPSGGHNNNPYDWTGDDEFGVVEDFKAACYENRLVMRNFADPSMCYSILPTSCFKSFKEDEFEFVKGSLDHFPLYQLGNITDSQLDKAAACLELTKEQYRQKFGKSLALRALPGLMVYIDDCECILRINFSDIFVGSSITVRMNKTKEVVMLNDHRFWKVAEDFGKIIVSCPDHVAKIIINYFALAHQATRIEKFSDEIQFCNINPSTLIKYLSSSPRFLKFDEASLFKILEIKEDTVSSNNQFLQMVQAIKKLVSVPGLDFDLFLKENKFFIRYYFNQCVCILYPELNKGVTPGIKLTEGVSEQLLAFIEILCMKTCNLLQYSIEEGILPAVRFLIEKKCPVGKARSLWSVLRLATQHSHHQDVYQYLSKHCQFAYRDYCLRYTFFWDANKKIWGFPNSCVDIEGDECDLDVQANLEGGYSLIPDEVLEEALCADAQKNQERIAQKKALIAQDPAGNSYRENMDGEEFYAMLARQKML